MLSNPDGLITWVFFLYRAPPPLCACQVLLESWTAVNETSLTPPQQVLPVDPKSKEGRPEDASYTNTEYSGCSSVQMRVYVPQYSV